MILLSRRFDILNIYINIMLPDILRCIPAVLFKFTTAMFVGPVAYMSLYDDISNYRVWPPNHGHPTAT